MAMQAAEVQELLEAIEVGIFTGGFLREHIKSSRGGGRKDKFSNKRGWMQNACP